MLSRGGNFHLPLTSHPSGLVLLLNLTEIKRIKRIETRECNKQILCVKHLKIGSHIINYYYSFLLKIEHLISPVKNFKKLFNSPFKTVYDTI